MSGDFIDTNIFIYMLDEQAPEKRASARRLVRDSLETGNSLISFQVVQETLNVITRKLQVTVTPDDARRFLEEVLMPLWRIMPSQTLYMRALDIRTRHGYGFYDALIVAAAVAGDCNRLYSEDLQHGQRIEGLTIQNPFVR